MTTPVSGSSSLSDFLADLADTGAVTQPSTTTEETSFQEHLSTADTGSTEAAASAATLPSDPVATTLALADTRTGSESDQNETSASRSADTGNKSDSAAVIGPDTTSITTDTALSSLDLQVFDIPDDPSIAKVQAELEAEGIDPSTVQLSARKEQCRYADRVDWIQFLRAQCSDGRYVDFDARLSEHSPAVTVCDIKHMLNHEGGWGDAA
jgi:hypothetical protein